MLQGNRDQRVLSETEQPDRDGPKDLCVGCINPRALVESMLGHEVDWNKMGDSGNTLMSDVLQKPYNELFDIRHGSPLYAGLKLEKDQVIRASTHDMHITPEYKRSTPNLSVVRRVEDLKRVGVDDIAKITVQNAWLENGVLQMRMTVPELDKTLTNLSMTDQLVDIAIGERAREKGHGASSFSTRKDQGWKPPNTHWEDVGDFFRDVIEFNDPIQGAVGDCWLIAALSAVSWAMPYSVVHAVRAIGEGESDRVSAITLHSKGGSHDAPTKMVEVTDKVLVDFNHHVRYCRSNDLREIWPGLYEKAFAKWSTRESSDEPEIPQLAGGDPAKAMAQLTNRRALYYATEKRTPEELVGIVRANSANFKTTNPMTAWTYASGDMYAGSNIVANHAYTILGWAFQGQKNYIVLRNPWGFHEPMGPETFQGILRFLDASFWRPINMIGNDGVFALETSAFKKYFAYIGLALPQVN
jgi:hypothetical protein